MCALEFGLVSSTLHKRMKIDFARGTYNVVFHQMEQSKGKNDFIIETQINRSMFKTGTSGAIQKLSESQAVEPVFVWRWLVFGYLKSVIWESVLLSQKKN